MRLMLVRLCIIIPGAEWRWMVFVGNHERHRVLASATSGSPIIFVFRISSVKYCVLDVFGLIYCSNYVPTRLYYPSCLVSRIFKVFILRINATIT